MKRITIFLVAAFAVLGVATVAPNYAYAAGVADQIKQGVADAGGNTEGNSISLGARIRQIVNVLLYILGAVAVLMIVVGGMRYTLSGGDSGAIKSAKDTILYAAVGLVVAILAFAIVDFVLGSF